MKYSETVTRNALHKEARIRKLLEEGLTQSQTANSLGISAAALRRYCAVLDIPVERKKRESPSCTPERLKTILELREQGFTLDEIGKRFKVSRERIRQILAKHYPDVAIQKRIAVTKPCVVCGVEFQGPGKTCSRACGGIMRQKQDWTRDKALEIIQLRKEGHSWKMVSQILDPGCNPASWRTRLNQIQTTIFSTAEIGILFNAFGAKQTANPNAIPDERTQQKETFAAWVKRIFR